MPAFSEKSKQLLAGCDTRLQTICSLAIQVMDFTVITGHRSKEEQDKAVAEGNSKLPWPQGKHNSMPSMAVDIAPYPIDWNDSARFYVLAGIMLGIAATRGIKLRWGGDWDSDFNLKENKFDDIGHFEIVG